MLNESRTQLPFCWFPQGEEKGPNHSYKAQQKEKYEGWNFYTFIQLDCFK